MTWLSRLPRRAFRKPDLPVDAQLGDHVGDGERRAHLERLGTRESPGLDRVRDRALDLALRGDSKPLEELPQVQVEDFFVHRVRSGRRVALWILWALRRGDQPRRPSVSARTGPISLHVGQAILGRD